VLKLSKVLGLQSQTAGERKV